MIRLRIFQIALPLIAFPGGALFAQGEASTETPSSSLWSMIEQGGWAMVPLGICSLALIYLIIHCSRETKPDRFGNEALADRL